MKQYYNDIYKDSEKYRAHYKSSNYYDLWKQVMEWIEPGDVIIDLGCGPGQFADMLYDYFEKDVKYTGVDFSGVAVKLARELVPYTFRCFDIFDYMRRNEEYNKILLLEVLEHIEEDVRLVEMIRPGTEIILSVPNYNSAGHVRVFEGVEQVSERYPIDIIDVYTKQYTETRKITMVKAKI